MITHLRVGLAINTTVSLKQIVLLLFRLLFIRLFFLKRVLAAAAVLNILRVLSFIYTSRKQSEKKSLVSGCKGRRQHSSLRVQNKYFKREIFGLRKGAVCFSLIMQGVGHDTLKGDMAFSL